MSIIIRPLTRSDREGWERLWRAYLGFYKTTLDEEIFDIYFERLLGDDARDLNCLLAVMDGKPVGLAHYLIHRHGWKVEDVCYLQDLFADPSVRGQGIGRALIEAVCTAAAERGASNVHWLTAEDNATARRLYDKIGSKTPFIQYQRPAG